MNILIPKNNPNFNYAYTDAYKVNLSKCIKVEAIIEMTKYSRQMSEEYWVTSLENSEREINEVIDYFNSTLRAGESPRKVIDILKNEVE